MSVLRDDLRERIRRELEKYPQRRAATLPALHITQDALRHVPLAAVEEIAQLLELHPSEVHDTLSFYGFFRDEKQPLGRHRVWVCRSLTCMLRGGEELLNELCQQLGVRPGGTTPDGQITLEFAECLGVCEGGPCMLVDDTCHHDVTMDRAREILERLREPRD